MRLIDADVLKEEIEKLIGYSLSYEALLNAIDNAPTVEDRPTGEWIFEKADNEHIDGYICSMCRRSFHTKVPYFSEYNYCPNCGADMRKGDTQ